MSNVLCCPRTERERLGSRSAVCGVAVCGVALYHVCHKRNHYSVVSFVTDMIIPIGPNASPKTPRPPGTQMPDRREPEAERREGSRPLEATLAKLFNFKLNNLSLLYTSGHVFEGLFSISEATRREKPPHTIIDNIVAKISPRAERSISSPFSNGHSPPISPPISDEYLP